MLATHRKVECQACFQNKFVLYIPRTHTGLKLSVAISLGFAEISPTTHR